ncbi:hypothetical protein AB0C60_25950, partial [Streptomyces sp. NPDC048845]
MRSEPSTPDPVRIRGLVKRYGHRAAVDGLDLTVAAGTVCAVLGPNGSRAPNRAGPAAAGCRSRTARAASPAPVP